MVKQTKWIFGIILLLIAITAGSSTSLNSATKQSDLGLGISEPNQPTEQTLCFEANWGQTDGQVRFLSRGAFGYNLFLTSNAAVVAPGGPIARQGLLPNAIRVELVDSNIDSRVEGLGELPGEINYLVGARNQWLTNVPHYARIHYHTIYPRVDLVYQGNNHQLEYKFIVSPGAFPTNIVLMVRGMGTLALDNQGNLTGINGAKVLLGAPLAYQDVSGLRQEISSDFALLGNSRFSFQVPTYDHDKPLFIDIKLASSVFSGETYSMAKQIGRDVDADGNTYIMSSRASTAFPSSMRQNDSNPDWNHTVITKLDSSGSMIFAIDLGRGDGSGSIMVDEGSVYLLASESLTKLSPEGDAVISSTRLPGTGHKMVIDGAGAIYVTGSQSIYSSNYAFVTKLNPEGYDDDIAYSALLDTHEGSIGEAVAVDRAGRAYVVGNDGLGVFLWPLSERGVSFTLHDIGMAQDLNVAAIAVDGSGNAYVVGTTKNTLSTRNPLQSRFGGGAYDAFAMKIQLFNTRGGYKVVYSTYLGGDGDDHAYRVAVDSEGNVYVGGSTNSTDFPVRNSLSETMPTLTGFSAFIGADTNAFVAGPTSDPDLFVTELLPPADLSITTTQFPSPVKSDSELNYKVTVTNNGPGDASDVSFTEVMLTGTSLLSAMPTQGTCAESSGSLECRLGALLTGSTATINIQVMVGPFSQEVITSTSRVAGKESDLVPDNNTATRRVAVSQATVPTSTPTPTLAPISSPTLTPTITATPTQPPTPTAPLLPTPTLVAPTEVATPTPLTVGETPSPPVPTPDNIPPTPSPGGGGCFASQGGIKTLDGGWLLLCMGIVGLALVRRRTKRGQP